MSSLTTTEGITSVCAERRAAEAAAAEAKPASRKRSVAGSVAIAALVPLAFIAALTASTLSRMRQEEKVVGAAAEAATALPRVTVVSARSTAADAEQVLPGTSMPLLEAGLFPRASGYIRTRLVDIGDRVKEGQLLAEIDSPDLDDQLTQARADLTQAKANVLKANADLDYARGEDDRYRNLAITRAASQEDLENKYQALGVARANVEAMTAAIQVKEAAVQRFSDL